jgi:hypothetical protein
MAYEIEIDQEITEGGITYSVWIEADLEYQNEEDPECCHVEITKAGVVPMDGKPLKLDYEGRQIEKLIVKGYPTLTETIDGILWAEIQTHTEDNYRDIMRDLQDARDDYDL